jgi:hypothetical protein
VLRTTAAARLDKEWLQRWWCQKYNRPRKDPLLAEYTLEELMIEFFEDLIEMEPDEAFPRPAREADRIVMRTGDRILDDWQEKAIKGEKIDFSTAFKSAEAQAAFDAVRERSRKRGQAKEKEVVEEFRDTYGEEK